jgi:N-acetylgalactosamine PTS system EIID component
MVSNSYQYEDITPAQDLQPKQIRKLAWRSLLLQASFNYERMQAAGWLYAILPGLRAVHKNKKEFEQGNEGSYGVL